MIIFKQARQLTLYIDSLRKNGKTIGFVPTMGALHQGHLSLIEHSKQKADITVCSIFINPTQFNNPEDFLKYPVTQEQDILQLTKASCDILFLPQKEEIYHSGFEPKRYELGYLETILEGIHRPGHFQGVCQVVDILLNIVQPHYLLLGQKDYQQCLVISALLELRESKEVLIFVPTIREADGLAMSSRNMRLNEKQRILATAIFEVLTFVKENIAQQPIISLQRAAIQQLKDKGFSVDYVTICNATTLKEAETNDQPLIALVAASLDSIRLIDNMRLN